MIKYIVIWVIASYTLAPPAPPKPDKFGVYPNSNVSLAVATYITTKDTITKIFDDKEKAAKFYEEAKKRMKSDSIFNRLSIGLDDGIVSVGMSEIKFAR